MDVLMFNRKESSYTHMDPSSSSKSINECLGPQIALTLNESRDELCPRFMRNTSYTKDFDSEGQHLHIQKEDSTIFKELTMEPEENLILTLKDSLKGEEEKAEIIQEKEINYKTESLVPKKNSEREY